MPALDTSGSGAVLSTLYRTEFEPNVRMLARKKSIFEQRNWFGKGKNSPIIIADNFDKGKTPGQTVRVDFAKQVNQAPVSGKTTIVGTAAPIVHYASDVVLHHHRLLLRSEGRLDEQKREHKLRKEWVPQFSQWAADVRDALLIKSCFTGATAVSSEDAAWTEIAAWTSGNYSSQHRVVFGGSATNWTSITQADEFNVDTAFKLAAGLRQAGRGVINIGGYELLGVCILSPGQQFTLKNDPRWESAQILMPQDRQNPFFSGALYNIDQVMYYADVRNPDALGVYSDAPKGSRSSILYHDMANAGFDKVEAICLSAQALAYAPHTEAAINPYEITEGGEFPGDIFHMTLGFGKVVYNRGTVASPTLTDVGVTYVATAAPNDLAAIGA